MKKMFKSIILSIVYFGLVIFLFGCDGMTDTKTQLEEVDNVHIVEIENNYFVFFDTVENADLYYIYVYNSTKTTLIKKYFTDNEGAISGFKITGYPGTYYITVNAQNKEGLYKDSEESDYALLVINDLKDRSYQINYVLNGGTLSSDVPSEFKKGDEIALPTPSKLGSKFLGWYSDANFTNNVTSVDTSVEHSIVLYAKWDDGEIDLSFTGYYEDASNLKGASLKAALRGIVSKGVKTITYDQLKQHLQITDQDPKNSNNVILFFSKASVKGQWDGGNTWNREHVWPQSLSWFKTSGAGSDIHHIRPVDPTVNSTHHNNRLYGMVPNGTAGYYGSTLVDHYNSNYFEPNDNAKGDTARIIFYLLVRYQESDRYAVTNVAQSMKMLLEWNELDPVDEFELLRNERSYAVQNNRNPFIDHPEFANLIWM